MLCLPAAVASLAAHRGKSERKRFDPQRQTAPAMPLARVSLIPAVVLGFGFGSLPVAAGSGAATVVAVSVNFLPEEAAPTNGFDVAVQAFYIAASRVLHEELEHADVTIRPQLPPLDDMRMDNNPAILAAGERAGRRAVPQVRAALAHAAEAAS